MLKFIEVTGKNEDEAIAKGLAQLGLDRDDVSLEILERGKTGFLGIGSVPAKVKLTYEAPDEAPVVEEQPAPAPAAPVVEEKVVPVVATQSVEEQPPRFPHLWWRLWTTRWLRASSASSPACSPKWVWRPRPG